MPHDSLPPNTPPEREVCLVDVLDMQSVRSRVVCPGVMVVGRAHTANVVLPDSDQEASLLHFYIELVPDYCLLTNRSDQGTFVNGVLVRSQCDLRHGDVIRASKSVFGIQILHRGEPARVALEPTVMWEPEPETVLFTEKAPLPEVPPPSPIHLPGYRLLRFLGGGNMGNVWLAEDRFGQSVACKLIRPDLAKNPETCARFHRETNHLRDLSHRHIVGFRDAGEAQGLLYLVMDYVAGCSLADLLDQQGPFAVGRAVRLTCQLLEALKEAHNNGVVHRDVKPGNILVDTNSGAEEIRLADFGLAKVYLLMSEVPTLTLPGAMGGTLRFAAPEMITDFRRAGPLADQYGAAATLYNLLTGRYPHNANKLTELLDHIRNRDAVPLDLRRPGLPEELTRVIHRALDREPVRRFPTIRAFRDALLPFAD